MSSYTGEGADESLHTLRPETVAQSHVNFREIKGRGDVHVTDGILTVVFGEDKVEFASDTRVVISSATVDSGLSFSYAGTGGAVIGRMRSNRGFVLTFR